MTRARPPIADVATIARMIEATPGVRDLRAAREEFGAASPDTVEAILNEAARFADAKLVALNEAGDQSGCQLSEGRVRTPLGHSEAWQAFSDAGWPSLDMPSAYGGQGLPMVVALSVQEIFDRSCPAFGMASVSTRSAVKLLSHYADDATKAEWLPQLISGVWTATICISEVQAGSDVRQIRTRAARDAAGAWRINGQKNWISFGDHDLTPRIGHCLLARTEGQDGLSLFLVPDRTDGQANGVTALRIEEKLGLHLSPTCALSFQDAQGVLLGQEGRGLQQLFVMITNMRLSVGAMGLGIASGASDVAHQYAVERFQGGPVNAPVAIVNHPDVQRMLLMMAARVETLRGLGLAIAVQADLAQVAADPTQRADAAEFVQWMLPIFKTLGAETASCVASEAIQVLGGAGYTRDWPVEQALRDARVLAIFEGATGIQAQDLVRRRLLARDGRALTLFLARARADAESAPHKQREALSGSLALLERAAEHFRDPETSSRTIDFGATGFLRLAADAATAWIAVRLAQIGGDDPASARLRALGEFWLSAVCGEAYRAYTSATGNGEAMDRFAAAALRLG